MTIKTPWGRTSFSWVLVLAGIAVLILGCSLIFLWKEGSPAVKAYDLKAEQPLELSWYLQRGDTTKCNFTISGGNEWANFTIKNPLGVIVYSNSSEGPYPYLGEYTAQDSGLHKFIFESSENATKSILVDFRSPSEPPHYRLGVLIVFGSIVTLFFGLCGLWSYYRYGSKQLESVRIDPAELGFWEPLISKIGKDDVTVPLLGKFRYWMWCILFGILLYISGGISAVLSDTIIPDLTRGLNKGFYTDFYFLTLSIVTGLTSLFAIRALRGLGDKLVYTDQHLADSLETEAKRVRDQATGTIGNELDIEGLVRNAKSDTWLRNSKGWYYASFGILGGVGAFVGWWTVTHNPSLWIGGQLSGPWIFFIACCGVIGLTVGALIFVSAKGITILCLYCKMHVLSHSISDPKGVSDRINIGYNPDRLSGLKEIGEFSFELDLAAAIPSFAFLASYLSGTEVYGLASLICLCIYTLILVGILFLPLYPFHVKMASAKELALANVNKRFCDAYSEIQESNKTDPRQVRKLKDVYLLQERIARKPVWPFPRWDLKLLATLSLPVLLSVLSTYISKLLGIA
jgi:hypothetical protein